LQVCDRVKFFCTDTHLQFDKERSSHAIFFDFEREPHNDNQWSHSLGKLPQDGKQFDSLRNICIYILAYFSLYHKFQKKIYINIARRIDSSSI
jgi:hypothetical protein